jgi:inorganic pyrophosphatase
MPSFCIIIETPKDSREKYSFDPESGGFLLKKLLPLGMVFPFDFGFIPGTKGGDGDPLDAMVFSEFKSFPGCRMDCRLVGMLKAEQSKGKEMIRNDRYFFIPDASLLFEHIKTAGDFPARLLQELVDFFIAYNREEGKEFKPIGIIPAAEALDLLKKKMGKDVSK